MKKPSENPRDNSGQSNGLIGRRRLVKVLAAGGGVATGAALAPSKWTQPIIESVTLPVHAQTTTTSVTFSDQLTGDIAGLQVPRHSPIDSLVAPAHAIATVIHAPIVDIVNGCIILTFLIDRVDVQINTLSNGSFFGSLANPGALTFDVETTGPYIVGVFVNALPFPTNPNGIVIGDGGILSYNGVLNGICSPSSAIPTPTL